MFNVKKAIVSDIIPTECFYLNSAYKAPQNISHRIALYSIFIAALLASAYIECCAYTAWCAFKSNNI